MWHECQNVAQGGGTAQVQVFAVDYVSGQSADQGSVTFDFVPDKVFMYCGNANYARLGVLSDELASLYIKGSSQSYAFGSSNIRMSLNGNTLTWTAAASQLNNLTHYIVGIKE